MKEFIKKRSRHYIFILIAIGGIYFANFVGSDIIKVLIVTLFAVWGAFWFIGLIMIDVQEELAIFRDLLSRVKSFFTKKKQK